VVTNPHNPSGALADAGALAALAELARGAGGRLVVDEVYRHALFAAAPPSAAVLGPSVVVTDSLTKAYGLSALRCGWVVGEPDLVRRIRRLDDLFGVAPAHPAVRLAVAAFDDLPRIAERARTLLERNTAALSALLTAQPDRLDAPPIGFGGLAFPGLRGAEVEAFCARLRERYETSVVPGRFFGAPDRFRIAVGGEPEMVAEGLARLATALREA
jgi:hypothetical protein